MGLAFFNAITINISRVLEALFDELEYHLAERALRQAAQAKAKRRSRSKIFGEDAVAIPSEAISARAT